MSSSFKKIYGSILDRDVDIAFNLELSEILESFCEVSGYDKENEDYDSYFQPNTGRGNL